MKTSYEILLKPLVTEKIASLKEKENKVAFVVRSDANKIEVKRAVEDAFKVKVENVHLMNVKGKKKKLGKYLGKKPDWKKALVTLKQGEKLGFLEV